MSIFFRAFFMMLFMVAQTVVAEAAYSRSDCNGDCRSGYSCRASGSNTYSCQANGTGPTAPTGASVCSVQFQRLMTQCQNQISSTDSNCEEKNNQGMSDVTSMAGQIALAYGAQSAASIQASCSSAAALSAAANGALAAYRLTCSSAIKDCVSTCDSAISYLRSNASCQLDQASFSSMLGQAQSSRNQCSNYTAKVNEAQAAMNNIAQTAANASQCASLTSADGSTLPSVEICKANPTMAGCANVLMDCNNPSMASNKVCICSKNPNDPACLGTASISGGDSPGLVGGADPTGRLNSATAEDFGGDLFGTPEIQQAELPSGGGESGVDGKQGGGVSFGGSSGGAGSSAAGGSGEGEPGDPNGSAVNAGYYGSGGGGAFGGGGSGGDGRGGGLLNSAANALAAKGGPDLRQFLPGGKLGPQSRGLAGATGPDGITGPHTDIWKKIQNRYQVMQPSLLP
ncbi:hypothetical protein [Bdellovibrio sp. HCB274]|uniref:hypothetical protein n=1 Tax=Bdellovibrio sp. HCB274 TaxID=3394361 RepID=UPI0039B4BD22